MQRHVRVLSVRVLSRVFRGKFIDGLRRAPAAGKPAGADDARAFERLPDASVKHDWVVYAKPPCGGPRLSPEQLAQLALRLDSS